jgi:hypothetical protein
MAHGVEGLVLGTAEEQEKEERLEPVQHEIRITGNGAGGSSRERGAGIDSKVWMTAPIPWIKKPENSPLFIPEQTCKFMSDR